MSEEMDYSVLYQQEKTVYVVKKDGARKHLCAEGYTGGREIRLSCTSQVHGCEEAPDLSGCHRQVDEMDTSRIPFRLMHNIVETGLGRNVKPVVSKSYRDYRKLQTGFCAHMI